jgi:hypothetical protein
MEKTLSGRRIFALSNRTNMFHTISWGEYFTVMGLGFTVYYSWWLVRYYPTLRMGRKGKAAREGRVMPSWLRWLLGRLWDTTELKPGDGKKAGPGAEGMSTVVKGALPGPATEGKPAGKDGQQAAAFTPVEQAGTVAVEGITAKAEAGEVIGKPDQAVAADRPAALQLALALPMPAELPMAVFRSELMGDLVVEITKLAQSARDDRAVELELVPAMRQLLSRESSQKLRGTAFEPKVVEHIVHELKRHGLIAVDATEVSGWWE